MPYIKTIPLAEVSGKLKEVYSASSGAIGDRIADATGIKGHDFLS